MIELVVDVTVNGIVLTLFKVMYV